jgi:hypothetical protein
MTEKVWRNLALQFDEHRMLALAHLRRALDTGLQNRKEIELFLQSSPRSGNEISAEADTLRADLARLRAVADVMAARFEFTLVLLVNETQEGIRYPDGVAALAAYRAALAHGEADQ